MGLVESVTNLFAGFYSSAPEIGGTKMWGFFLFSLLFIAVLDVIFFGWRPLVKKLAPEAYPKVDHIVVNAFNVIAGIGLLYIVISICVEFATLWPGIMVVAIVGGMFGWRFARSKMAA